MGLFPKFGSWINLNTQEPTSKVKEEESERSQNVKSNSGSKKDTNNDAPAKEEVYYYDKDVEMKQDDLWHEVEKKHKWYDAPPKVKVTTKKGICHMNIEFTVGMTPASVYNLMTNPTGSSSGFFDRDKWLDLMKAKSRKVLKEDGPKKIVKSEKIISRDFLWWWSIPIPITLVDEENQKDFITKYKKEKLMFMKVFEGNYKVEPIYVDAERLCKHKMPKSKDYIKCSKEYMKCSNGQGKIASKVIMEQCFQPYPLFNLMPPLSWYIQGITIKTTKNMLKGLQSKAKVFREAERVEET